MNKSQKSLNQLQNLKNQSQFNRLFSKEISKTPKLIFQPCEISEVLNFISPQHYQFKFPGQYDICDYLGELIMGTGTPTIIYEKYCGTIDHIYAEPEKTFSAFNEFYALFFANGLKIGTEDKKSLRQLVKEIPITDTFNKYCKQLIKETKDYDPRLDEVKEYKTIDFEIETPVLICFRKDVILETGEILRRGARPIQFM